LVSSACFAASSSSLSDNARTRSTTRPKRDEVERIMLPQAEISTAGVIIAVSTATAEDIGSTFDQLSAGASFCVSSPKVWLWF